jgi:DNA repair photolyase
MRTVMNPPISFESQHRDFLEPAPHVQLKMFEDVTRHILSRNESPDLPFRWKGELILFSGNTDCYQPLEASLELTRACLEVCAEYRNPVGIITKGVLVLCDLDLLRRLHQEASVHVYFSIPFQTMR